MKQKIMYLLVVILAVCFSSCSDGPINKIALKNMAAGDVYLSFRGSEIMVPSQSTVELEDIDQGEYEYETVYSIPFGATSFSAEGEMAGTVILGAGTKILIIYSSTLVDGSYTIYASVTTSENLSEDWWENIINPINP